jgi:hypothetical protein
MPIGTHAEISRIRKSTRLMILLDPEQFTYLDLLHESRHFEQIRRIELQSGKLYNFNNADIAMFERGAYEYELPMAE